jgi:5-methylcytosine-specific restriction endonuclease McrA
MPRKTPPFEPYPEWTTAKFWGFIRSKLRAGFTRWPPKYELLNDVRRIVTGKRHKYEFQCNLCKGWFKQKEVEVDHIVPVGALKCPEDLAGFVSRMFVGKDKLQVVCKTCHKEKTKRERDNATNK